MTLASLVVLVLAFTLPVPQTRMAPDSDPLATYRWTHRLLIVDVPDTPPGRAALASLREAIETHRDEVLERDLLIVPVGDVSSTTPPLRPVVQLDPSQRAAVRRRLALSGTDAALVLIGKDGGAKARQSDTFELPRLLALIDTMPMRRAETPQQ